MPEKPPKRRFLQRLRRDTVKVTPSLAEEGALWGAHAHGVESTEQAARAAERAVAIAAKQRSSLDAGNDESRALAARIEELQRQVTRLAGAFEQLNVIALNAGLEGARLGEGPGKALSLVGDEVRSQADRGALSSRETSKALGDCARELGGLATRFDDARTLGADMTQHAAMAASAAGEATRALGDLGERLRKATGSDPETAQAVAQVMEHARSLATALATLGDRVPRSLVSGALRPVLEPLVRSLLDDAPEDPK